MAKEKDNNRTVLNSPRGVLKYPKLTEVDHGTEKFPDKDGTYNTRLVLDTKDAKVSKYLEKLDALMEVAREEAEAKFAELPLKARKEIEKKGGIKPDMPYSEIYDEDTEEPTGEVELRFKKKAGGVRKKDGKKWQASRPDLFDARNKPLPAKVQVWGGTVATVNASFMPYFVAGTGSFGLQRQLQALQIIDLVSSGGQRSAGTYGFEEDEDGFDASGLAADDDEIDTSKSSGDDDDDDAGVNF